MHCTIRRSLGSLIEGFLLTLMIRPVVPRSMVLTNSAPIPKHSKPPSIPRLTPLTYC